MLLRIGLSRYRGRLELDSPATFYFFSHFLSSVDRRHLPAGSFASIDVIAILVRGPADTRENAQRAHPRVVRDRTPTPAFQPFIRGNRASTSTVSSENLFITFHVCVRVLRIVPRCVRTVRKPDKNSLKNCSLSEPNENPL